MLGGFLQLVFGNLLGAIGDRNLPDESPVVYGGNNIEAAEDRQSFMDSS